MLDALLKDIPKVKGIRIYHVVASKVTASKVPKLKMANTVNSASTSIDAKDGVKINGATDTTADVEASNGVIHIIVTVMPKLIVRASRKSTCVFVGSQRLSIGAWEVACGLKSLVCPGRKSSVVATSEFVLASADALFDPIYAGGGAWLAQGTNPGLDILRLELQSEVASLLRVDGPSDVMLASTVPSNAAPPAAAEFLGINSIELNAPLPITTQVTLEMWVRGRPQNSHAFFISTQGHHQCLLSAHTPYSDGNVYFDGGAGADSNFDRINKLVQPADDVNTWGRWTATTRDIPLKTAAVSGGTGLSRMAWGPA